MRGFFVDGQGMVLAAAIPALFRLDCSQLLHLIGQQIGEGRLCGVWSPGYNR
jgi:hypothetical protein